MEKKSKKSLKGQGSRLADNKKQLEILTVDASGIPDFKERLDNIGLFPLRPTTLEILQINVGYMCNLTCEHCHVDAGPDRKEIMSKETLQACLSFLEKTPSIHTVDLTGGAPEMNPHFEWFVEALKAYNVKVIVRSNLTILVNGSKFKHLPAFFKLHQIEVVASLPCYTAENTDKQRGDGVFTDSIKALKILNDLGYGKEGTGLNLHLVFNPGGPSIAPDQSALEGDYKRILKENFGVVFNQLFTITNIPMSRFLDYLLAVGRYQEYMLKLSEAFNPNAAKNVMCRNTLSVRWDGVVYDCDFNQQLDLGLEPNKTIFDLDPDEISNREIVLKQHCYGCTAGAGSSCQGAIV